VKSHPATHFVTDMAQWRQVHFSHSGYDATCLYTTSGAVRLAVGVCIFSF